MEGRCQCGAIRFTTPTPKPLAVFICHCSECRHQSSSAHGISVSFPAFEIPAPEGAIGIYSRSNSVGRTDGYFCTACGSRLYHWHTLPNGEYAPRVAVKGGCLEGLTREMLASAVHIWTESAVVPIPEGAEAYAREPPSSRRAKPDDSQAS